MTDGGSKDDNSPCGVGALQAGVFWLLEEKILHIGRSGVNRGDRKIFGGKRRMSPDRFCLIRATASYGWSSFVAFVERHEGRVPLIIKCTENGINESRFVMRAQGFVGRESGRRLFSKKIDGSDLMTGAGIMTNRWWLEMLESLFALADYRLSLSALTFEGGDLHWRLLH